jgi:hypothetical protein
MALKDETYTLLQATSAPDWAELWQTVEVLFIYAGGIAVYALVVNVFYQILSHRTMFGRRVGGTRVPTFGRFLLYVATFPVITFAFFLVLTLALLFLSAADTEPLIVFTTAMAIVLAVRVLAYINQAASHDVAKMLPLGLLGVFLVTQQVTSFADSAQNVFEGLVQWRTVAAYFAVVVVVEFTLRMAFRVMRIVRPVPAGGELERKPPGSGPT